MLAAAAAGKATFCEKPIALTLAETDSMLAAIEKAGILFQVGFMRRFDKDYAAAQRQIESGEMGSPVVISAISRDPNCPEPDWAALAIYCWQFIRQVRGRGAFKSFLPTLK